MKPLHLIAAAVVLTGTAATATTAAAVPARTAADCLADTHVDVPAPPYNGGLYTFDALALTPAHPSYSIGIPGSECTGQDTTVTVARPDGSSAHDVAIDQFCDHAECGPLESWGNDTLDYTAGTGTWRVTQISAGGRTATLTHPVSFTIKRATTLTFSVPAVVTLPARPRATGVVKAWNAAGALIPAAGRRVTVGDSVGNKYTTTTDSSGRYSVLMLPSAASSAGAQVPSTATQGWVVSPGMPMRVLHPTSITGTAAPTNSTVIRNGTKMSTYGHLTVLTNSGKPAPMAGRTVVVQTRPKSNPSAGYSTVATATTTNTGYYYTNWNATVDADVRVAFISPYQTITSSFRWIRSIDVR